MKDSTPRYFPRNDKPAATPEVPVPPGDLPKSFPEKQPLSDDGLEAAKKESASTMKTPDHAGEDRSIESGETEDDPEQPRRQDGEAPM